MKKLLTQNINFAPPLRKKVEKLIFLLENNYQMYPCGILFKKKNENTFENVYFLNT